MSATSRPTSLTILKVRRTRKHIVISYRNGDEEHPNVKYRENPMPAFDAAIGALAPLVCQLLNLPETYVENMKATGLTLTDASGNEQVTIVAQKSLQDFNGPFNIATPLRLMELPEADGSYSPPLTDAQRALVDEVVEQAKAYVLGERAQGTIKFEKEEADENHSDEALTGQGSDPLPFPAEEEKPKRGRKKNAEAEATAAR